MRRLIHAMAGTRPICFLTAAVCLHALLMFIPAGAWAASGTTQVAGKGTAVGPQSDWPKGVLELVNDPLRANGWNPWFSGCPSDRHYYEMAVRNPADVQHLVGLLAAVKSDSARIVLDPRNEPTVLAFSTALPKENRLGAVFSIGSQKIIDEWYARLPEPEPGIRKFGVVRYEKAPRAEPPTLTLYVGSSSVDLSKLEVPTSIAVEAGFGFGYREQHPHDPRLAEIDKFVRAHKARREGGLEEAKGLTPASSKPHDPRQFHGLDLTTAPSTTRAGEPTDLWEERPKGSQSFEIRADVKCVYSGLDGSVYYVPAKNCFYVQCDPLGSSTMTFYGPFQGDPKEVLKL